MYAIETENLTRRFGSLTAVDGLNLRVVSGEIFGLVGPDGAGKTTTMRLLAAILDPTAGSARILGKETVREAEAIKGEIGYMSQRFGLYPDLTVLENIQFHADLYGVPRRGRQEKIEELLAFSHLTPFKERQARNLSGGMKQKLGLACALVHTPRVLFLDEPTNGVDPVSRRDFWRILYQLVRQGLTIFVSTAYLDEAERCSRVGLMHRGRLLAADTPEGIRRLMPETLLEVRTEAPRRAMALLREGLAKKETVGLFGDRLHVATTDPARAQQQVPALLRAGGINGAEMRVIEPSLEDVFVAVVQRESKASQVSSG